MKSNLSRLIMAGLIGLGATASPAAAGSVENLERERAIMLETMLKSDLTPQERHEKVRVSKRRLIDLERIVLRDKALTGRNSPAVNRAFANYDLTFLAHASTEKNLLVTDHWLEQLGLTSQNIMAAARRRR
jgi:hypothetical protein